MMHRTKDIFKINNLGNHTKRFKGLLIVNMFHQKSKVSTINDVKNW